MKIPDTMSPTCAYRRALLLGLAILISACSSEGIDRTRNPANSSNNAMLQNDGSASNGLGSPINNPGPNRYIQLEKLNFEATPPSVVSVLFHATDQYANAMAGLQTSDFVVQEDNLPVPRTETSLSIVPHDQLPFSLKTVIMIDVSSSILPTDLNKVTAAVRALLVDDGGNSNLLPQQEVALYTFNDTITRTKDFSSNAQSLVTALDQIVPAIAITPTDLYGAMIEGAGQFEDSFDLTQIAQGSLIVITDGSDTAGKHSFEDAVAATFGKSVYALGVGTDVMPEVLQSLGRAGSFSLRDFDQLKSTLQTISRQVQDTANSFYYLHYASPKRRAAGDVDNSNHILTLSVVNNANTTPTGHLSDTFNSAEFSNVQAQVVIAGPAKLEVQQRATYHATTRWGPTPTGSYNWELTGDNGACAMNFLSDSAVRITGITSGFCTISATDAGAGNARAWYSVNVVAQ